MTGTSTPTGTATATGTASRPTRSEDGLLRRLHLMEQLGARLAPDLRERKLEIRSRDLRGTVREPVERDVT
jgi:hypothetical protein